MFNQSLRITRFSLGLLLSLTLGACMSERPPPGLPDARVVTFDGVQAHGPDCASIALPSHLGDPDRLAHPAIPFGCANYTNLAAQLARPADIAQPTPYAGADGTAAARSVQRYDNPPPPRAESQDSSPATSNISQ
ncbi:CpaD family pilus assembly lipoprotein [Paraburkholderia oxyphila]|uniref:CpaD family pilus assembly lipoprotein n=1 Tax=Paraburkholderia oxyphila TaxID=614212 RepID=UPI0007C589BA|nr:CpaD family pilus assembly lipoprotein [Paraburkholderia oxyphila]